MAKETMTTCLKTSNIPSYVKNINNKSEFISKQRYYPANTFCFPRRLQDFFKTCSQDVFKMSWRRLHEDVLKLCVEDVFLKTSWKTKNVTFKTSSVRLHQDECLLGTNIVIVEINGTFPLIYLPSKRMF